MEDGKARFPHVRAAGHSDIGVVREENQDSLLIREPEDDQTLGSRGVLLAVADGMGGLCGGKIASRLAIDTVSETYYSGEGDAAAALTGSVQEANRAIYRYSRDEGGGQTMGSTVTAAAILKNYACIANVGDSRAYRYREGEIRQITRDHSLIGELQNRGQIGDDLGPLQAHRNVLTRGLGLRESVDVDLFELNDITDGDVLLLTSDGLHELVDEEEFVAAIERHRGDLDGLCAELVNRARERGGPDNITMVVARLGGSEKPGDAERPASQDRMATPGESRPEERPGSWFLPLAFLLTFVAGMGATLLFEERPEGDELQEKIRSLLDEKPDGQELRRRLEEILDPAE